MPKPRTETPPTKRRFFNELQSGFGFRNFGSSESESNSPRALSPLLRRCRFSSVPLVEIRNGDRESPRFPASVELPRRHISFYADSDSESSHSGGGLCSMSDVLEGSCKERSGSGNQNSQPSIRIKHITRTSEELSRFPKLDECAHFHYDNVELGPIDVSLVDDRSSSGDSSTRAPSGADASHHQSESLSPPGEKTWWGHVRVCSHGKSWEVKRSLDNFLMLDRQLHCCVHERKFSGLTDLTAATKDGSRDEDAIRAILAEYLERFSQLAGSLINCGPVLNWLELDNRGYRLIVTDEAAINTPAVAAAYVTKRYAAQASDEIHLQVGDIISVIDMPPPDESTWWRGKKGFQVGFFPCECVEIIGDKIPQTMKIPKVPSKPVLRKHGKLIAFFRQFLMSRPTRRKLKQSGILKERVFGCDLGEHLMNTARDIPLVLKCCADFIEEYGIVDGIYRLSGVTSNIQKLRLAFDEDRVPNLMEEAILQDIHCVASLLKMYFRELPNPLLTFHLYDKFVNAVQADENIRLLKLRDVVQQLPPPHYRSLEYLMRHLNKVAANGAQTGMTPKNVAIVWAPNLLRSRDIENGGISALHVVGVQAVLTEYLIRYMDIIFSEKMPVFPTLVSGDETPKKIRPKSLAISTPTKLLSLEEARSRALVANCPTGQTKFIEVGGGVENLPSKYHTVIDLPARRSMGKGKKSPIGWRSFFSRGWHTTSGRSKARRTPRGTIPGQRPKISSPIFVRHSPLSSSQSKAITESEVSRINPKKLRTVKSVESLLPNLHQREVADSITPMDESMQSSATSEQATNDQAGKTSSLKLPSYQKHARSTSHESYFEHVDVTVEAGEPKVQSSDHDKDDDGIIIHFENRHDVSTSFKKQNLITFESSPKVHKTNLKRMHHSLNSPPSVRKKESSDTDEEIKHHKNKARRTHFSDYVSTSKAAYGQDDEMLLDYAGCLKTPTSASEEVSDDTYDDSSLCLPGTSAQSDKLLSMEATISETISVSQLMSFESKNDAVFSPGNDGDDTFDAFSAMPLDVSPETQDSMNTDNVSELPSSVGSDFSCSPGDNDAQKTPTRMKVSPIEKSIPNSSSNGACTTSTTGSTNTPCLDEDDLAKQTKELQIGTSVETAAAKSPYLEDNLILSPPENFVDYKNGRSPSEGNQNGIQECHNHVDVSSKIKATCAFAKSLVESGKDFTSLIQEFSDSWSGKKRNEKVSPISPIEDSRRRFESEIGRLIVRDRQMRLEMEQMQAERQKWHPKQEAVAKKSNLETNATSLRRTPSVSETKKSPVRKRMPDVGEAFCTPKDNQDTKKFSEWTPPSYPQYMRMDKKPSVKELLSKFEVQQKNEKEADVYRSPPRTRDRDVFSNLQVINHDVAGNVCDRTSCSDNTNRDHIFQTECVVRFPYPKATSIIASSGASPKHKIDDTISTTFLNSYLRSRTDTWSLSSYSPTRTCFAPSDSKNPFIFGDRASPYDSDRQVGEPSHQTTSSNFWPEYKTAESTQVEDCKPSVKLKKKFLEEFGSPLSPDMSPRTDLFQNGTLRPTCRRLKSSPTKQRPRSVPPPKGRLSVTSSTVRPTVASRVSYLDNAVPKLSSQSSQREQQPKRIRERAAMFERSLSFSAYGDDKALEVAPHFKESSPTKDDTTNTK